MTMTSSDYSETRLSSLEALATVRRGLMQGTRVDAPHLDALANALETAVESLAETAPLRTAYHDFASMLRALGMLVRWADAVRSAAPDATRFLLAAQQAVGDLRRRVAPRAVTGAIETAMLLIEAAARVEDVEDVVASLLCVSLPLPLGHHALAPERDRADLRAMAEGVGAPGAAADVDATAGHLVLRSESDVVPVAFLRFGVAGEPTATDVIAVQPDVLYDLAIEATLSRWPSGATHVEFVPMHVEPAGSLTVPTFRFSDPAERAGSNAGSAPLVLVGAERLRVHGAHDLLARPLEVTYVGHGIVVDATAGDSTAVAHRAVLTQRPHREQMSERGPTGGSTVDEAPMVRATSVPIDVRGHRRLALRALDPRLSPTTGFPVLDSHLDSIRTTARRAGFADCELAPFLALLSAVAGLAQRAVTDALYPGAWTEADFQRDLRDRLRAMPHLGADLHEHPRAGGGITDLVLRGITLELKVDDAKGLGVANTVERFGQQAAQYVAASGRRCGLLVLLDVSAKDSAPGLVQNDIALEALRPPDGGEVPVWLGVVILRGNLARPSALSRTRRPR